jgi:Activator of Hsp90 ATPase homolog 1-like protein
MTAAAKPGAVTHRIEVSLDVDQAFALFTDGISRWWPFRSHSCAGDGACDVVFEPRVGGAVIELTRAGDRHLWGSLTAWQPPTHFSMTWHPAQPSELATCVSVRFTASDAGCVVELRHDGWGVRGAAAPSVRDEYQHGWVLVLGRYAATAAKEHRP